MTTLTDPPAESFKLSMLVYDTRYRAITFQILALLAFLTFIGWLISNTAQNLADLGKEPSFAFLYSPAGYDINQTLIDYNNQDPHIRAAFIGLLNTLLVAFMGCVTATIVGVLVGVLRLSNNWLVARLMTIYVEMFRNVPVLMWIVLCMAVLIESLPAPSAFRGDDATSSMVLFDSVAVTNRGVYVPEPLFSRGLGDVSVGGYFEISLDLFAFLIVLAGGIFVSRQIAKRADAQQEATGVRPKTWYLRLGVIAIPLLVLMVALGFHLGLPELKGFNFQGGTYMRNSLIALWLALSLYTAAFIAENVRAGILAISKGQTEAAAALGLRPRRITSLVGYHPAADLAVSEPDQELIAGHRGRLHGHYRDPDGDHAEPDGAGT